MFSTQGVHARIAGNRASNTLQNLLGLEQCLQLSPVDHLKVLFCTMPHTKVRVLAALFQGSTS